MAIEPTRRGKVVAGVAVAATLMGWLYGGRTLNFVVMPTVALLAVGAANVARKSRPTVERHAPKNGYVGDDVRVELTVTARRPTTATVSDEVGDGLVADAAFDTTVDDDTLAYELGLAERGVHAIGPARITVRDAFGLWERRYTYSDANRVTVFPQVRPLRESTAMLSGYVGLTDERDQFDTVREYRRGDALRDINWKASAKRADELMVTEFAGEGAINNLTVAAECVDEHQANRVAEAAASVAVFLIDAGIAVGVITPGGHVTPGVGADHRRQVLSLLARFEGGRIARDVDAEVAVGASPGSHVHITVEDTTHRFVEFVTPAAEEVPA